MQEGSYQERRLVTVLFADFAGFTTMAEELDPEVLQETVSAIFEDLAEIALSHDGTIEKFIGDAIFVVFGAPLAHEDDPQRALRSALGMQRRFADHAARIKRDRGIELGLRIGVHTGLVVAGHVRSVAEYGVMGDTVNTAARLEAAAAPGEIYVTEETFRLTHQEFSFREVGPIQLRGKERPIMAYALGGERGEGRQRIEMSAPLVGRWMELSRLDLAFQSARAGHTEIVILSGEPGIGKSRLVSEFLGLAAPGDGTAADDAPRVMRWTFSRVNQRSYAGFIEPILVELGIEPTAPDAADRLASVVRDLGFAQPAAVAPLLAQFLHLPGAGEVVEGSEARQRSMYIAVYDLLSALARTRPILYVLEDLHYADAASLELFSFVADRASGAPILFLLAARPGASELRSPRANLTQLVLQPLSDDEAARIVETIVPLPDQVRDRIVARAGGNPFFIEESIRSLVESGVVERDEAGAWRLARVPKGLEVPATLHAVVAARIDRLPPLAKEAIQLASVIGVRFGDRVLRASGGQRVADAVDQLISADLIVDAAPGERREGRYRFKHAVTQEVAYSTLLVRRRVELHRTVAQAMEDVLRDELREFYGALAHHYLLGDVPEKAAEYAWRAAQRALSIHAYVEVIRFAEQALELFEQLGDTDRAVEALYVLARIRRYRGENDAALAAYQRALALLEQRAPDDRDRIASAIAHMAELCTRWDAKHPDLEGLIARGLAIVGEEPSRERVLLLAARAFMPRRVPRATTEDWEASLATAQEALAMSEELGLLREVSLCLDAVGYAYRELGRFRDAYAVNQRRLPIAESLQDNDELIDAHNMCAGAATVLDDLDDAIEHASRARQLAVATEKPRLGTSALQYEATARLLAGQFEETLATVALRSQLGPTAARHVLPLALAAAAALASPDETALHDELASADAPPRAMTSGDLFSAIWGQRSSESAYHAARGAGVPHDLSDVTIFGPPMVVAAARWRIDDADLEERVSEAVERSGHMRGRALLAQARGLRALERGENTKAAALLLDAVQAFATLRLDHERAVALGDRARALARAGDGAEARAEIDEARRIAERIHAAALLGTLEAEEIRA
ncbi:MAG: AAA family ATPase [Chloroflexota bacterium]|nr:AAA family ATPase [Chloroflexota bacterium]MDE3194226.1 AAA family ATPase [Chloroflexota bacterium]